MKPQQSISPQVHGPSSPTTSTEIKQPHLQCLQANWSHKCVLCYAQWRYSRKTIAESIAAHKKDHENKKGGGTNASQTSGKVSVTVKDSNSRAFMVLIDPAEISTPSSVTKFAGIAPDAIPDDKSIAMPIETVEYERWLMFEEEPKATIN